MRFWRLPIGNAELRPCRPKRDPDACRPSVALCVSAGSSFIWLRGLPVGGIHFRRSFCSGTRQAFRAFRNPNGESLGGFRYNPLATRPTSCSFGPPLVLMPKIILCLGLLVMFVTGLAGQT